MSTPTSLSLPIVDLANAAPEPLAQLPSRRPPLKDRKPLPMSMEEAHARGWDELDIVFISGDAYIDHPSFAAAILGRVLESAGFRVGIVAQPDWRSCEPWRTFGKPKLFFAISAGNMDSMINHYTANRKVRNDDAYSPGGRIGQRPDRVAGLPHGRVLAVQAALFLFKLVVEERQRLLVRADFAVTPRVGAKPRWPDS